MEIQAQNTGAVAATLSPSDRGKVNSLELERELSSPDSTLSVSIGVSEGNRTQEGGYTEKYYGHTDPGNGKSNLGTFSRNGQSFESPLEADQDWLKQMRSVLPEYREAAQSAGLDPGDPLLSAAFFDLYTQSPAAATAEGGFLDQMGTIAEKGISQESIVAARVASYHDPSSGQLDAPGFDNDLDWVTHDQTRRTSAVASVVEGQGTTESASAAPQAGGVLALGSEGAAVKELQQLLNQLGYTLEVSGKFDAGTDAAVKDFQTSAGLLPADGIAGPKTMGALQNIAAEQKPHIMDPRQAELLGQLDAKEVAKSTSGVVSQGSLGELVKHLQDLLNKLGAHLEADGSFGPATDKAVKNFQREEGLLPADGVVGPKTMKALEDKVENSKAAPSSPVKQPGSGATAKPEGGQTGTTTGPKTNGPIQWSAAPTLDEVKKGAVLKRGNQGDAVAQLQKMLNKAGAKLTPDGQMGDSTVNAVKDYQKEKGMKVPQGMEGMVGATTLQALEADTKASKTDNVVYYTQNANEYEPGVTCANTSMGMMMDTHGVRDDSVSRTPDYLYDTYGKVQDVTSMADIYNKEASAAGLSTRATATQTASLDDLRAKAEAGEASVVGGYFTPNPGHFLVVTGYDKEKDQYIVNDPRGVWNEETNGTHDTSKSGEGIRYDAKAFEDAVAPDGNVWMINFTEGQ